MAYQIADIKEISYRSVNAPFTLPTEFRNVALEFDNEKPTDFEKRNAVGKFILDTTGYTPLSFEYEIRPIV